MNNIIYTSRKNDISIYFREDGGCDRWFHMKCVNVVPDEEGLVAEFKCNDCKNDEDDETQE